MDKTPYDGDLKRTEKMLRRKLPRLQLDALEHTRICLNQRQQGYLRCRADERALAAAVVEVLRQVAWAVENDNQPVLALIRKWTTDALTAWRNSHE